MSSATTRTLVLGVLHQRPMHGYEVRSTLEGWGADHWAGLSFGTIYFALKKMTEEGLVEVAGTEQPGSRPVRTVYAITDAGRSEFRKLVQELWWEFKPLVNPFAVAVTFIDAIDTDEVLAALRSRIAGFRSAVEKGSYVAEAKRQGEGGEAAAAAVGLANAIATAELEWLEEMEAEVASGTFAAGAREPRARKRRRSGSA
jgi:DNA-binding PadR family transcriptional regulator